MSTETLPDAIPPRKVWLGPFRLVFLAAVCLSLLTFIIQILISIWIQPLLFSSLNANFQLYSLLESVALFTFNPIVCLLVFYKIGSKSDIRIDSDYFGLLTYSFVGGVLGYSVSYFMTVAFALYANGGFGPSASSAELLTLIPEYILGVARGGIDMALIAFAGVTVGLLRSASHPIRALPNGLSAPSTEDVTT